MLAQIAKILKMIVWLYVLKCALSLAGASRLNFSDAYVCLNNHLWGFGQKSSNKNKLWMQTNKCSNTCSNNCSTACSNTCLENCSKRSSNVCSNKCSTFCSDAWSKPYSIFCSTIWRTWVSLVTFLLLFEKGLGIVFFTPNQYRLYLRWWSQIYWSRFWLTFGWNLF